MRCFITQYDLRRCVCFTELFLWYYNFMNSIKLMLLINTKLYIIVYVENVPILEKDKLSII